MEEEMYVIKRNGEREPVKFEQITERIQNLCDGLNHVDAATITYKTVRGMSSKMTTIQLDELASQIAAAMTTRHPEYGLLAGRIAVSNLHKQTKDCFSEVIKDLYEAVNARTGKRAPAVCEQVYNIVQANAERLNAAINFKADFDFSYFGILTLQRSYLLKINNKIAERPQHMLMRVALGIHREDINAAIETYNLLSERWFTHATPTLFNSGTTIPQMSSCFLLQMTEDSIDGIFKTLHRCAMISKTAGGIGLSVHNIRAAGSYIAGTNGISSGLIPMLQVFNSTARYVDQGGNKRPGAVAIYLEPWHSDVFDFLDLRKNTGPDYIRARDLFLALWVPDLFMERVHEDGEWSLMCPDECPGLSDVYGDEFVKLYTKYEAEGKYKKKIPARNLWFHIIDAQIETGTPYMLYKDACNKKSNQKHLGTIKSSNLCTEIIQYTSPDEVAVCNLASIALNRFVDKETRTFDFEQLKYVTSVITKNLNKVIDVNYYPIPEARNSNMRHRPIGIGVQGLADAFILMRYPFDGPEARKLNKQIFETIYFAACKTSCELAQEHGPYETFQGSPASEGQLQYDLWGLDQNTLMYKDGWAELKQKIAQFGMRNSLLVAPMPTASTAQILGNNESMEPYTSNMYVRRVLSGEFQVVNQHLIEDLVKLGLWNEDVRYQIMRDYGSVQSVAEIPDDIKALYKNVWEIQQKSIIDMAADRAPFVDQSQSMNIHFAKPKRSTITSMHFYGWRAGLKTGMYYLRTKPAANPIQFTLDETKLKSYKLQKEKKKSRDNGSETPTTSIPDDEASSIGIGGDATNGLTESEACSLANGPDCQMCSG